MVLRSRWLRPIALYAIEGKQGSVRNRISGYFQLLYPSARSQPHLHRRHLRELRAKLTAGYESCVIL
jgi:hypothetical protein